LHALGVEAGDRLPQRLETAAEDRHARSLFEERAGGRPADAGAGSRDEDDPALVGVVGPRDHDCSDSVSAASAALSTSAATATPSTGPSSVSSCSMLTIMSGSTSYRARRNSVQ